MLGEWSASGRYINPMMPKGWSLRFLRYTGKRDNGLVRRLRGPGYNYPLTFFASSSRNLVRGLVNRVLTYKGGPILQPNKGSWERLSRRVISGLRKYGLRPTPPMSTESWLSCYRGRKLTIYRRAVESLRLKRLGPRDFEVKAFVKREKDKITLDATLSSDPRIIQPRDPRVTVTFGPFVRAIEGKLYKHFSLLWRSVAMSTDTPVCMKGFNYLERGLFLRQKWDSFADPVAVALDASRFDLHVSNDALRFTDDLYRRSISQFARADLDYILKHRHRTVGVASCREASFKYEKQGGRCSGDVDTSLGNVCIMLAVSVHIADILSRHIELVNDGDDQIFLVERSDLESLLDVVEPAFEEFGLRVKVEDPVDVFERVDFCQTRPVLTPRNVWIMTRYPKLAMTKDLASFLPIDRSAVARNMAQAIGDCGRAAYGDMPVLGEFYGKLVKVGGKAESHWKQTGVDLGFLYHVKGLEGSPPLTPAGITPAARVSFWRAFGIPPVEQIALEDEIRDWNIEFGPVESVFQFSSWWKLGPDQ